MARDASRLPSDNDAALCPYTAAMRELALDSRSSSENLDLLAEHLDTCSACVAQLETQLGHGRLSEVLGSQPPPPAPPTPPGPLLERLTGLAPPPSRDEPPPAVPLDFLDPPRGEGELGWLGPFRVRSVLGQGGMGLVLAAEDSQLGRPLALKVLRPGLSGMPEARERFRREARCLAAVQHPHVVAVHQIGRVGEVDFLIMERLEGETLEQRLRRGERLDLGEILRLGRQAAMGLAAAHDRGLIHRDLKPSNLFLTRPAVGEAGGFTVKILDFGLARPLTADRLTQTGLFLGTPSYAAPEQLEDGVLDARADLFSLGAVLYRLLAGRPAFEGNRVLAVLKALALDEPPPLHTVNPEVPEALSTLVGQLLAKDPAGRPASALEVAERLENVEAIPAATNRIAPPACLPGKRGWLPVALLALAASSFLVLGAVVVVRGSQGGTLEIQSEDPDAQVLVEGNGEVALVDLKSRQQVRLTPGEFRLKLWPGKDLHLETDSFVLKRGDKVIVRVACLKPNAAQQDEWTEQVRKLPADKQVEAVRERLKKLNPGFDGTLKPHVKGDKVVGLEFATDEVADVSPVRALADLRSLTCTGSGASRAWGLTRDPPKGKLRDLGPLKGLKLTRLIVSDNPIEDLSPLAGMPLTYLDCYNAPTRSLEPLRGMKLEYLLAQHTFVSDLQPLVGMPLDLLYLGGTPVADLSGLREMRKLRTLGISGTRVRSLEPLRGLPLSNLDCSWTAIKNLEPLRDSTIGRLGVQVTPVRDLGPIPTLKHLTTLTIDEDHPELATLRGIPTLVRINERKAAQFWKDVGLEK